MSLGDRGLHLLLLLVLVSHAVLAGRAEPPGPAMTAVARAAAPLPPPHRADAPLPIRDGGVVAAVLGVRFVERHRAVAVVAAAQRREIEEHRAATTRGREVEHLARATALPALDQRSAIARGGLLG